MANNNKGHLEVDWDVTAGTLLVIVGDVTPKFRINLKTVEPSARQIRDGIVSAFEHALSERFELLPSLENRE